MAVRREWFIDDLPLTSDSKKAIEQTTGKWIVEVAEMSGLRKVDVENLKAFLSRRVDRARPAYGRSAIDQPRQFITFGTTNHTLYLKDLTGNRRFWPLKVGEIKLDDVERDRDQLWAEAAAREAAGASIRLDPSLWDAAAAEQRERTVDDPWHELLAEVFGDLKGKVRGADVWDIVGVDEARRTQVHNERLGSAMKALGFERKSLNFDDRKQRGYARGSSDAEREQRIYVVCGYYGMSGAIATHSKIQAERLETEKHEREEAAKAAAILDAEARERRELDAM